MIHRIFIASYAKDFPWLKYCLISIARFARGFAEPVVCVGKEDDASARQLVKEVNSGALVVRFDGVGFMRAQLAMMRADLICPPSDVLYLVGSDCLFTREFGPGMYCRDDKPVVLMNSLAHLSKHGSPASGWTDGVRTGLGVDPKYEYMRRLPSVYPAEVFAPMRAHVERTHGEAFDSWVYRQWNRSRDVSEANWLGAYAHHFLPESCRFVCLDEIAFDGPDPVGYPSALRQFWSHGGLDRPIDGCQESPRQVIAHVLGICP